MMDKYLLCLWLLFIPLCWAEDTKVDMRRKESDMVPMKNPRLFARRKISPPRGSQMPKLNTEVVTPARRCSRLMESCAPHVPCCDPCTACRCRLFNTICYCLRMGSQCSRRS